MNTRWLLRMARWAQNPPGEKRVKFVFAVIAISLLIAAFDQFIGFPEWMRTDPGGFKFRP